MPELPEVETVRTGLEMALKGAVITSVELRRKDLRTPFPANFTKTLAGRTIKKIDRRAKYLLFFLDYDDVLIAHLGMSGRFIIPAIAAGTGANKHDHVIFTLKDGRTLIYNDPRRFGLMTLGKKTTLNDHKLLAHLGPEPLEKIFSPEYLKTELLKRKGPIKSAIMDQSLVVGVGNIYASEALFLAKVHPIAPAYKAAKHSAILVKTIQKVLSDAIASGGSSLRDFLHVSGEAGYFQHQFNVYARAGKPCFRCHIPLRSIAISGRSTFFCPNCQK